jgi:hypothetical protein
MRDRFAQAVHTLSRWELSLFRMVTAPRVCSIRLSRRALTIFREMTSELVPLASNYASIPLMGTEQDIDSCGSLGVKDSPRKNVDKPKCTSITQWLKLQLCNEASGSQGQGGPSIGVLRSCARNDDGTGSKVQIGASSSQHVPTVYLPTH